MKQDKQGELNKKGKRVWEKEAALYRAFFAVVLGVIAFLSFYRLDAKYVDPFDEARHGVNAYEMLREGSLIRSTYRYETDYYNLKPPLSMWCIILDFLLLGKNVLALRVYSALCYLLLAAAVGSFVRRHYGKAESILAMCFLAVNTAPFQAHMIRAGDADSLYVLLFTLAMLCMLEIPARPERLQLCGLFFSLAFLTKSFHAGLIVVIGGLYLLLTGELFKVGRKNLLGLLLGSTLPIVFWAFLRVRVDGAEFLKQMLYVDVLGRTNGALDNNRQPFLWYADYFFGTMSGRLTAYLWALVICVIGAVHYSHLFTRKHFGKVIGYLLWAFVPFLAFSAVTNKLIWYLYPATIPLLMCAGIVSGRLLREKELAKTIRFAAACGLVVLFITYGRSEVETIQSQGDNEFQALVTQAAREYGGEVKHAYLAISDAPKAQPREAWEQQDVYLAEVYGDWYCDDGGIQSFAESDSGILFVSQVLEDQVQEALSAYEEASGGGARKPETLCSERYVVFVKTAPGE